MIIPNGLFVCLLLKDHAKGVQLGGLGNVHAAVLQQICSSIAHSNYPKTSNKTSNKSVESWYV